MMNDEARFPGLTQCVILREHLGLPARKYARHDAGSSTGGMTKGGRRLGKNP
jgi:hypothetical protein